ncbi:MAG: phosphate ABC transporter permease PstA [Planctomycetota bacterium]
MSTSPASTPPSSTPPGSTAPARGRSRPAGPPRRSALFAAGEPMIWLTGGSLALALVMILGLLTLVAVQGFSTFWPSALVRIETTRGTSVQGEVTRDELWAPPELQPTSQAAAAEPVEVRRRLVRTGNYEITGEHFQWVSDHETTSESLPEWGVVVERLTWGRFYGEPVGFLVDGQPVAETPAQAWAEFEARHDEVRERWSRRRALELDDVGDINHALERERLTLRSVELEQGLTSPGWQAANERFLVVTAELQARYEQIRAEIRALDAQNEGVQFLLRTVGGEDISLPVAEIVRAYPANQLAFTGKLGLYLARWGEFLWGEPREANSEGGVWPAIFGTVMMTLVMSLLVVPFGVLAALYLREYARPGAVTSAVRIAVNNLAGVPSIVFGVFGLGFFCYIVGGGLDEWLFSERLPSPTFGTGGILWASFTLALLTLPVVIVATEEALAAVPGSMREGSYACGASKWQTIRRIVLPRAMPGVMTGIILAMARGAGEVAPLMLVGVVKLAPELPLDGYFPFLHLERSFMHLGFHIYDVGFQSRNSEAGKPMVFVTTLLLIALIFVMNVGAIAIRSRLKRKFAGSQF